MPALLLRAGSVVFSRFSGVLLGFLGFAAGSGVSGTARLIKWGVLGFLAYMGWKWLNDK